MAFSHTLVESKNLGNGLVIETGTWNGASVTTGTITPAQVQATALVVGRTYRIITAGSTTWTAAGSADSSVGTTFVCTAVGTGTGMAQCIAPEPAFNVRKVLFATFTSNGNTAVIPSVYGVYANQIKITFSSSDTGTYTLIGEGV